MLFEVNTNFSNYGDQSVTPMSNLHQTLGPAGLALHYANVILQINNLVRQCHSYGITLHWCKFLAIIHSEHSTKYPFVVEKQKIQLSLILFISHSSNLLSPIIHYSLFVTTIKSWLFWSVSNKINTWNLGCLSILQKYIQISMEGIFGN